MAPVADTRTSGDAFLEQRELREGNAVLVQQKDTVLRELAQWQPVLHAVKAEIAEHLGVPVLSERLHSLAETTMLEKRDALQAEIDEKTAKSEDLGVKNTLLDKQATEKEGAIAAKTTQLEGLKAETTTWEEKGRKAQQEHHSAVEKAHNELTPLLEEVGQARNHLAGVKLEEEVLLQNRADEDQRLATKSRDLAIYEGRIREAAAKVGIQINL